MTYVARRGRRSAFQSQSCTTDPSEGYGAMLATNAKDVVRNKMPLCSTWIEIDVQRALPRPGSTGVTHVSCTRQKAFFEEKHLNNARLTERDQSTVCSECKEKGFSARGPGVLLLHHLP